MTVFSLSFFLAAASVSAKPVTLARGGTTTYKIVIDAQAVPSVEWAAKTLQDRFKASTGATLPIERLEDFSTLRPASRVIVVGQNDYTRRLGLDPESIGHDGYATLTDGRNLIIAGRDDDGDPFRDKLYISTGSIAGVGRFLHDHLGVVQYLPGERWLHVPEHDKLVVDLPTENVKPSFLNRQVSLNYIVRGDPNRKRFLERRREVLRWARLNGAGSGTRGFPAHETDEIMSPYVENDRYVGKPEWVALYNGRRLIPRTKRDFRVWYRFHLCTSNAEVRDITVNYVRQYFKENPEQDIAGISLSDGDRYCQCTPCVAQDAPGIDSKTDRYLDFASEVARRVKDEFPDKYVGTFIYAAYIDPPVKPKNREIPENLLLFVVKNGTYYYSEADREQARAQLAEWSELAGDRVTFYSWPASHGFLGLPLSNPEWLINHIQDLKKLGYWGYRQLVLGSLHARQPDSYLWGQLTFDIKQDPEALLERYYRDLYGEAASTVRQYHQLLAAQINQANEEIELEKDLSDDTVKKYEDRVIAYYEPLLAEARSLLDQAASQASGDDLRSQRVRVLSDQFRFVELMVAAIQIGKLNDENKATPEQLAQLDELRVAFHEHVIKHANTDVYDVRDLTEVPRYGRDDLMRYLLIPIDYEKWFETPIDERPSSKWQDLSHRYLPPTAALSARQVLALPDTWDFILDPAGDGEQRGLPSAKPNGQWRELLVTKHWIEQGIESRSAGWYTTEFRLPGAAAKADDLWLLFNAVDGHAKVWIDGTFVGDQTGPFDEMWNKSWALHVSKHLKPGSKHRITIRVEKTQNKGQIGIWRPIEIRGSSVKPRE
ncbi:MAG: DUF4838 domain-containing protein [Planctomycetota bacterium]